jgi:NADPH:quinone reductase-like Zn-dependent oxidoreductase
LIELYEKGGLNPVIGGVYPMPEIGNAMKFLLSRKSVGKLIMRW